MSTPAIPPAAARAAAGLLDAALLLIAASAAWYLGAQWMKEQAVAAWTRQSAALETGLRAYVFDTVADAGDQRRDASAVPTPATTEPPFCVACGFGHFT